MHNAIRVTGRVWPLALALTTGCAPPPPPPPAPAPPPEPQLTPYHTEVVWTAHAEVPLAGDDGAAGVIPNPFTRLVAIGTDSTGLIVRCEACDGSPTGYVEEADVTSQVLPPEIAAWGSLGEFALAVHNATMRRDLEALRPVMAPDFSFSLVGVQNPDAAFAVWRAEEFESLDAVPRLLAGGLASLDGSIWSAPLEYVETLTYRGLRLGFRKQPDGRWSWLYLIRGIGG